MPLNYLAFLGGNYDRPQRLFARRTCGTGNHLAWCRRSDPPSTQVGQSRRPQTAGNATYPADHIRWSKGYHYIDKEHHLQGRDFST